MEKGRPFFEVEAATKDHHPASCPNGISGLFEARGIPPVPDTLRKIESVIYVRAIDDPAQLDSRFRFRTGPCCSSHNYMYTLHGLGRNARPVVLGVAIACLPSVGPIVLAIVELLRVGAVGCDGVLCVVCMKSRERKKSRWG